MEQRVASSTRDNRQCRIGADDIVESLVVDMEWLCGGILLTQARGQENLHSHHQPSIGSDVSSFRPCLTTVRFDTEGGGTVCKLLKLFWSTN